MRWSILAIALIVAALGCGEARAQPVAYVGNDWITHRPRGAGFRIRIPADWVLRTSPGPEIRILVAGPATQGDLPNCRVAIREVSAPEEIGRVALRSGLPATEWEAMLGQPIQDFTVVERRLTQISSIPGQTAVVSASYGEGEARIRAFMASAIIVQPRRVMHAVCTAGGVGEEEAARQWARARPVLMAILGSWVIED